MNINPTNISDEEKTRIFNESMKRQKPYVEKEPVRIGCVNQWISVEDRLPDNGVEVIINEVDMGIIIGWYDTNAEEFQCDTFSPLEVTHWMSLPEPPNKT